MSLENQLWVKLCKSRDEIYEKQRKIKSDLAIVYTGEIPKEEYVVAFDLIQNLQ